MNGPLTKDPLSTLSQNLYRNHFLSTFRSTQHVKYQDQYYEENLTNRNDLQQSICQATATTIKKSLN